MIRRYCEQAYKRKRDGKLFFFKRIDGGNYLKIANDRPYTTKRLQLYYSWVPPIGRKLDKKLTVRNANGFLVRVTKANFETYKELARAQHGIDKYP